MNIASLSIVLMFAQKAAPLAINHIFEYHQSIHSLVHLLLQQNLGNLYSSSKAQDSYKEYKKDASKFSMG
jgi:hypothetical protein